jgi:hypothetical protein
MCFRRHPRVEEEDRYKRLDRVSSGHKQKVESKWFEKSICLVTRLRVRSPHAQGSLEIYRYIGRSCQDLTTQDISYSPPPSLFLHAIMSPSRFRTSIILCVLLVCIRLHLKQMKSQRTDRLIVSSRSSLRRSTFPSSQQHSRPYRASCDLKQLQYGLVQRICSPVQPWLPFMAQWPTYGGANQRCSVPSGSFSEALLSAAGLILWLS